MWHRGANPANAAVIAFDDSLRNSPFIVVGRRATSPAVRVNVVIAFDAHRRLACPINVAQTILDGADAIRPWFGVTAVGHRRLAITPIGPVSLDVVDERWDPSQHALEVRGSRRRTQLRGHLTFRSIVHAIERGRVVDGTEIWVHVELTSAEQGDRLAKAVPLLLHRGLDLLPSELDAR